MEDILAVYQRVYDEHEVLVCLDETSKQQVQETRIPVAPENAGNWRNMIMSMKGMASATYSCCLHRWKAGGMSKSRTGILK